MPRRIEPKYLSLEDQREKIRAGLLARKTESLIRQAVEKIEKGQTSSGNADSLKSLTQEVRRTGDRTAKEIQEKIRRLDANLQKLGELAGLPYNSTGLVTQDEAQKRAKSNPTDDADDADFFTDLTTKYEVKSPGQFAPPTQRSLMDEIFGRDSSAIYLPQSLIPAKSSSYSLEGPPTNIGNTTWSMRPGDKYFYYVVLEEVAIHLPTFDPIKWTGEMTLENINRDTGYDVLVAPPGEDESLTVAEWFDIVSADGSPVRSRHLEVEKVDSDGTGNFIATEFAGRQTIQQVVEQSLKMQNAAEKAMERAEELQKQIEKAGPKKSLNEVLDGETISGDPVPKDNESDGTRLLKHQLIQSVTTQEFSWRSRESSSAAATGLGGPQQLGITKITDLPTPDDGQGAGNLFMEMFCNTVKVNNVGTAFSYDKKAVYVGRVTKRTVPEPQAFDDESDTNPMFLSREPRETANFFSDWLDEFKRSHNWNGQVQEQRR